MADEREQHIDRARPVRAGEELDIDRLRIFLTGQIPDLSGPLTVEQFGKGHSNLTYLLRAGEQELVLRRPPFGAKIKTAHDMGREFRILSALRGVYPKIPRPLAYCEDEAVIGAPFYVMRRVRGVILRGNQPPPGLELDAETMRTLSTVLIDSLAELHAVDLEATGLRTLGKPEGYVERQVRGWTRRYVDAQTDEVPAVEAAAQWLAEHQPSESGAALIHGDFKYDNLVLDPNDLTRIVAVLDWEMATIGDPLMDLGTSLAYWIDPADPDESTMLPLGPTLLPGNLDRRQLLERYAEVSGRDVTNALFYYVYGLFKVAVIAQQIYQRFKDGHTRDPRFGVLIVAVKIIGEHAARAIDKGRIYDLG